jgi:hypothetical protein
MYLCKDLAKLSLLYQKEMMLSRLQTEYDIAKAVYIDVSTRYEQARLQVAGRSAQLQLIDTWYNFFHVGLSLQIVEGPHAAKAGILTKLLLYPEPLPWPSRPEVRYLQSFRQSFSRFSPQLKKRGLPHCGHAFIFISSTPTFQIHLLLLPLHHYLIPISLSAATRRRLSA